MTELINSDIINIILTYGILLGVILGAFCTVVVETIFNYFYDKIVYQIKNHKSKKEVDRYENS